MKTNKNEAKRRKRIKVQEKKGADHARAWRRLRERRSQARDRSIQEDA